MKTVFALILILAGLYLVLPGCKKKNTPPTVTPVTIVGKWFIIRDSIVNVNNQYFFSGGSPNTGTYVGTSGDFFNFNTDGTFTASEEGFTGNGTYHLVPDSVVNVFGRPGLQNSRILELTGSKLTVHGTATSSNGGVLIETMDFKR